MLQHYWKIPIQKSWTGSLSPSLISSCLELFVFQEWCGFSCWCTEETSETSENWWRLCREDGIPMQTTCKEQDVMFWCHEKEQLDTHTHTHTHIIFILFYFILLIPKLHGLEFTDLHLTPLEPVPGMWAFGFRVPKPHTPPIRVSSTLYKWVTRSKPRVLTISPCLTHKQESCKGGSRMTSMFSWARGTQARELEGVPKPQENAKRELFTIWTL